MNFKIHENMLYDVRSVIYVMKCRSCGEEYIGETAKLLRKRVTVHNQQIRDPQTRILKVCEHIDICANMLNPKYYIFPIQKAQLLRRARDKFFMNTSFKPKLDRAN